MILHKYSDFKNVRKENLGSKIVYTSGTFDLLHAGHVLFFEEAKSYGDVLVVSTPEDSLIKKLKGEGRPILNQHLRSKMIDSLKPVNYCFINKDYKLGELELIFKELKPDFYVVNYDAFDSGERKKYADKFGIELRILERKCPPEFEDISTSKIIEKILNQNKNIF